MDSWEELRVSLASAANDQIFVEVRSRQGLGAARHEVDPEDVRNHLDMGKSDNWELLQAVTEQEAKNLGSSLFETLFRDQTRTLFDQAVERSRSRRSVLRVRLEFDLEDGATQWMQALPWEMTYWPVGRRFLVLDRGFSLVRSIRTPLASQQLSTGDSRRCLLVTSSPRGTDHLFSESETNVVVESCGKAGIVARTLRHARLETLRDALQGSNYNVLHFAGHGYRSAEWTESTTFGILLEDKHGDEDPIESDVLGRWVGDSGVRLIVLNACWSGAENVTLDSGPFQGVAQNLVRLGIPVVLAMQHPIADEAAPSLAKCFYRSLARGDSIESALTETRIDMQRRDWQGRSWLTPVLFLQSSHSQIFSAPNLADKKATAVQRSPNENAGQTRVVTGKISGDSGRVVGIDLESNGALPRGLQAEKVDLEVGNILGDNNIVVGKRIRVGGEE